MPPADAERHEHECQVARPAESGPAATATDGQTREIRKDGPAEATETLGREVQAQAQAKEAIERTDTLQVARAGIEHRRIRIEQSEPRAGVKGSERSDQGTHRCRG